MNALKSYPRNPAYGISAKGGALQEILSDVIEPSPRYFTDSGRSYVPDRMKSHPIERSPSALSELRAPKGSYRIGFSEFLD